MQTESKVIACIDQLPSSDSVTRHGAWAAQRSQLGLELLHIIERHPALRGDQDHSGTLGMNAQETLLAQFAAEEELRSRRDREQARTLLSELRETALSLAPPSVDTRLRHGDLEETIASHANAVALLVLGRHDRSEGDGVQVGHHVASTVRRVRRPALVVGREFREPRSVILAFDGSSGMRHKVLNWSQDPWLAGVRVHVVATGTDASRAQSICTWATSALQGQGVEASGLVQMAPLPEAIAQSAKDLDADWVVMGAYGRAFWKRWLKPSHTDQVLRAIDFTAYLIPG